MSQSEKYKDLINKRGSIKGRLTKFKNSLDILSSLDKISEFEISKLAMRLAKFETLFVDFDELQIQIEASCDEASQAVELESRDIIEQDFYHCILTAQNLIKENTGSKDTTSNSSTTPCHHDSNCHNRMPSFKLPVIQIPKFDGTYSRWLEFKETFTSLIHNNDKIENVHKFHYLNSYLEGEAARVMTNFEVSNKNYFQAWNLLCKRYDNKRQLINNHLKSLFNFESVRETDKSLRFVIDHVTKNLRALSTLGLPTSQWDVLIIFMVSAKLDTSTLYKWEEYRNTLGDIPTLDNFFGFLKGRADVLETVNRHKYDKDKGKQTSSGFKPSTSKAFVAIKENSSNSFSCILCKSNHRLYECNAFKAKTPDERLSIVSTNNLCQNCLRSGHAVDRCPLLGSCRHCKKRHNSLLHKSGQAENSISMAVVSCSEILLSTARVKITNPVTNDAMIVRTLLDSGSQSSFVTERVKVTLNLTPQPTNTNIVGIGDTPLKLNTERCVLNLFSQTRHYKATISCLILPTISGNIPKMTFNISHLNLSQFQLADPSFNKPAPIDMLIGADLFWEIIGSQQHQLEPKCLRLHDSQLGWLVAGPMQPYVIKESSTPSKSPMCNFLLKETNFTNLNDELSKFWELESFPKTNSLTTEEKLCEKHYVSNTTRTSEGRFCVALPLRDSPSLLGDSHNLALKRLFNLESRFQRQPALKALYVDFINEYEKLGHLSQYSELCPRNAYYLPHHPVLREQSESTKLRVVFDASARTTSGISVNDLQMVGPTVQNPLFDILVRFRQHKYVLTGDIEKMFRQVLVNESDRNLQLILWRDDVTKPIKTLRLNTVTYGFASASFLTTRCLWQIGEECDDPVIKSIIQNDLYCDDALTGAETIEQVRYIRASLAKEFSKGCFRLRKYRSNLPELLSDTLSQEEGELMISNATSTLGIGWIPSTDEFNFPHISQPERNITKRQILSSTFKVFDPLGLLSLCTIKAKILLQILWNQKIDWDERVPPEIETAWLTFAQGASKLSDLKIPRYVLIDQPNSIELHCFCDASERAYGCCIYLRSCNADGMVVTNLLCAKSRVAPLKSTTIPRLELCAALLGAELSATVTKALRCTICRHIYWTDSSIVLGWLISKAKPKTFVANRVAAIHELSESSSWRYVPTQLNPADLLSRGVDPDQVCDPMWWTGPPFLREPESAWPVISKEETNLPELKAHPALVRESASFTQDANIINISNFSKFSKLQRVVAFVLRFISNCKNHKSKLLGPLQVDELKKAHNYLVKLAQEESFGTELNLLKNGKSLKPQSTLISLDPFLDADGIIRVGGRLNSSMYPFDKKHPIVLKGDHDLTRLLFRQEHHRLLHAGPQLLLASVRERYWPIAGRNLARRTSRECMVCRRLKGRTLTNIMGQLPLERLHPNFPYSTLGTDFAGPFYIADRKGRGAKIIKCYLCIFVCFCFKCVHLEAVSDLTMDAFILTLKRFIARRGKPNIIYCDNGRNFVAASKEINYFLKSKATATGLIEFAAREGIEFRLSPAYAPNYGGLFEAGVKSAKFHLHRVLKNTHLTFEELSSLFVQVEAILNSRPLCPLSPSPNDLCPLTPGHFLIGRPLTSLPSPCLLDYNVNNLDRYRRLEQARQHFWKRWSTEYVSELQQRTKWRVRCRDLRLDDLVVIKDDAAPPLCWRLGRISKLYPGPDGVPRVADIATSRGSVRRALNKICMLPSTDTNA